MISTCYSEQPTAAELGGSVRRRWCGFLLSGDGGGRGVDGGEAPGAGDEVHHARRHGGGAQDLRPHHLHRDQPQGQAILPLRRIRAPHLWPRLRPRRPRRRHVHRHCRRRRCQDVDGQVLQDPRLLRRHRPHHRQGRLLHCRHRGWLQRPHQAHRQGPTPPRHRICY